MPTNYPTSIDSPTSPTGADTLATTPHSTHHDNHYDAIVALETACGIDGSAAHIGPALLQGFKAWTFDVTGLSSSAATQTSGTLYVVKLLAPRAMSVTSAYLMASNAATSPTGAYAALYNSSNVLLATSANASAQFTGAGLKTFTFSATTVPAGVFYVGYWQVASAACSVLRAISAATLAAGEWNANTAATTMRSATANTGLTTTAPDPVGTRTAYTSFPWVAVS